MARDLMAGRYLTPSQRKDQAFGDHDLLQKLEQSLLEKNQTEQARKVRELMAVLEYEMWLRDRPQTERLYFGGSLKVNDLLDFVMWRDQADKLGITLTQADIRTDINREALNFQPLEEDSTAALAHVQRMFRTPPPNLTIEDVYTALGDELRVYLAQSAVLGYPPGARYYRYASVDVNHVPATATPDEFWRFYQDNRTTLRVEMLPIKVEDFLSKVGQPPPEAKDELKTLFQRHENDDYDPNSDMPAFRVPRRVSTEWVSGRADSPHQRRQADNFILAALASGAAGNPLPAVALSTQIIEEYDRFKNISYSLPGLMERGFEWAYYRNATKPVDVAAALGQAMGAMGTGANPASVATLYVAGVDTRGRAAVAPAMQAETQRRAGVDATLVLSGLNPWAEAALFDYASNARQNLPLNVVQKEVTDRVRDDMARRFLIDDLKTVQSELEKLKGRTEEDRKKDAENYLAKAAKDLGLSHGTTEKPRDFFDIADDKGLKPLAESYRQRPPRDDLRGRNFATLFFDAAPTYVPEQWPSSRGQFDFLGARMWEVADEPFLYWKTADVKAYTPSEEEAQPKVIEAWRFQQAQKLALQEAQRIQEQVAKAKDQRNGLKLLREESARNPAWGEMFPMMDIARLVPVFTGGVVLRQYGPYQPDEDKIKARADFVDQLMRSLKEPGDATIVWNRPRTIYYVALLTDIARPDLDKFYREYKDPHVLGDNLWQYMEVERRKRYYQAMMEQLRADAGAPKGKWDVSDDMRKRIEGRESGSE
jgi:hypothetical protein